MALGALEQLLRAVGRCEFDLVPARELVEKRGVVAERLAQVIARRDLFAPLVDLQVFFTDAARPKAIHERTIAIVLRRFLICAFYDDLHLANRERAHDAVLVVRHSLANLVERVHHEGAVGDDRLVDRLASEDEQFGVFQSFHVDAVAIDREYG